MVKNPKIGNDEINLIELMFTLWEGKWKIAVAVIISLIAVISYELTTYKTKNFTAITKIKPISIFELNKFLELNNLLRSTNNNTNTNTNIDANTSKIVKLEINKITSLRLLEIYINILKDNSVFEDAIRKFNLLEASQYNNEQEYSEAIIRLASSVKISTVSDITNLKIDYPTISFKYHDVEKWKSVLTHVDEFTNKLVKKTLTEEYDNYLLFLINQKKYQLEDISIKIKNILIDYEREISNYLAYLKEQSALAKKLGIEKIINPVKGPSIVKDEEQTFGNKNTLFSVQTDSTFYLRGYEAIDKEIELIESRKDKKAFISGLFNLEKKKRAIEQSQTIARFELALQSTPLSDNSKFTAASINTITTKFKYKDYKTIYVTAIAIGLIAGIFYVLISNAFQLFRFYKKN